MEDRLKRLSSEQRLSLSALLAILLITAAWWALALWPTRETAPVWLLRTRLACFGTSESGLPDAGGWILLIGQPISMLGFLLLVWGRHVRRGLRVVAAGVAGRSGLGAIALLLAAGLLSAGWRVAGAGVRYAADGPPGEVALRLDRPAPPLQLVDQHGRDFQLDALRGRPVLLAFAFAHCETVCPLIIRDALEARARVPHLDARVVVVTLDPWRDTPARLSAIARQWRLGPDDYMLGGDVQRVMNTLDAWDVSIRRDLNTGSIDHSTPLYLINREGRFMYATTGGTERIAALLRTIG
jgi:protein SCO1/2